MTNTSSENSLVAKLYPWGMGQSEIVLQNDFGDAGTLDSEEISDCSNGIINPDNAAINIEHSSDVIIGPVTQFHGPVTIFQNVNGNRDAITGFENLENNVQFKAANLTSSPNTPAETYQTVDSLRKKLATFKKYSWYLTAFIVLLIILCASIYFGIRVVSEELSQNATTSTLPVRNNTVLPGNHRLIYREEWGGRPIKNNTIPLPHPTPIVIIAHTAGQFCVTFKDCAAIVSSIQNYHVAKFGSPDAGYNFLIGGDANIYVARGWDITNFHRDNTIGISFIGNFNFDELTPGMKEAAEELLAEGIRMGKLSKSYSLLCHNQTYATESPGVNVYKVVKTWPNWKAGKLV